MNKQIFRFYILATKEFVDVVFDSRLSFIENFILLKDHSFIKDINDFYILEYSSKTPLKKDIPISEFNFETYTRLLII